MIINGTTGNDQISGTTGNDQITAGLGNDSITGAGGRDKIYFSVGDGVDSVVLSTNLDPAYAASTAGFNQELIFNLINSTDVVFERHGWALVIKYGASDVVSVEDFFTPQTKLFNFNKSSNVYDLSDFDSAGYVYNAPNYTTLVFADRSLDFFSIDQMNMANFPADSDGFGQKILAGSLSTSNVLYGLTDTGVDLYGGNKNDIFYTEGSADGYTDAMLGMDGDDQYIVNGAGMAFAFDQSMISADTYKVTSSNVSEMIIIDQNFAGNESGQQDVLDLSAYRRDQFEITRNVNSLVIKSAELNINITVLSQFIDFDKINLSDDFLANDGEKYFSSSDFLASDAIHYNSAIESFVFSDTTYTSNQIDSMFTTSQYKDNTSSDMFLGYSTIKNTQVGGATAERFYGGNLVDTISAGAGDDKLYGYAGNDLLDGGLGNDLMKGGLGDDSYTVDSFNDTVIELASEGNDKITTVLDGYTLGANVEWLYLTGTTAVTGSGNELNNRIYGNTLNNTLYGYAGNDYINGGVGNDTMVGGLGNDVYVVNSTKDVIVENANEGTDGVEVSFSYTLQANVENLTLFGSSNINGTGNSASNVITGNNANNILNGKAGSDTLVGKLGNDTYLMNRGNMLDTIVENDSTAGNADVLKLGADIRSDQLWFKHVGNNLEVRVIGTTDRVVVRDWYLGDAYHVENISAGDGKTLSHQQVENLVSAMSTMTMPASGQTSLSASQQSALAPVLAANWH